MTTEAGRDLGYVREVVQRSEHRTMPPSILYLWAAISAVGFTIVDLAPRFAGWYWLAASLAGFAASMWLGSRGARAAGQESRAERTRHLLHWGGMLVAILFVPILASKGHVDGEGVGLLILLIVALGYWYAGVHLIPALRWMAAVAAATCLALAFVNGFPYPWTAAGLVLAAGLIVAGISGGAARGQG